MDQIERPVGPIVPFTRAAEPDGVVLVGDVVRLEMLEPETHGAGLWAQMAGHDAAWDYLFEPPPADEAAFIGYLRSYSAKTDWLGYAILVNGAPMGYAYYLNIVPDMGTIEVGNINFSPALRQSPAASEAMFLMMRHAFEMGYRRYEWKCNALNGPSRAAAQRLGFSWEGIFRQHMIVQGRNRDTAWFAITDVEWPQIRAAFEAWLSPDNFDTQGRQRRALRDLTGPHRVASDPAQMP